MKEAVPGVPLGIHVHDDADLAVANSLAAVAAGVVQVQGCINGYGERCGNANLTAIIANLQLKMGLPVLSHEQLARLTDVSRFVAELANLPLDPQAPYVGLSAFAHKGRLSRRRHRQGCGDVPARRSRRRRQRLPRLDQ